MPAGKAKEGGKGSLAYGMIQRACGIMEFPNLTPYGLLGVQGTYHPPDLTSGGEVGKQRKEPIADLAKRAIQNCVLQFQSEEITLEVICFSLLFL